MRRTLPIAALVLLAACSGADGGRADTTEADSVQADSLTQRQRDSIIGESRLPGAGAVRRALEASDAAAERAATHDSLSGGR